MFIYTLGDIVGLVLLTILVLATCFYYGYLRLVHFFRSRDRSK